MADMTSRRGGANGGCAWWRASSTGGGRPLSWRSSDWFLYFFFQAEDGIRDRTVTGVQTCALPIYTQSGSFVALPLIVNDEPAGVLLLYARVRDFFDDEEMRLLHELAGDISFALHRSEERRVGKECRCRWGGGQ